MTRTWIRGVLVAMTLATLVYWIANSVHRGADVTRDRQLQITQDAIAAALKRARPGTPEFSRILGEEAARRMGVPAPPASPIDKDRRYLANLAAVIASQDKFVMFEPTFDINDEFPDIVAVLNGTSGIECSGVLLDPNRVLTLDHCLDVKGIVRAPQVQSKSTVVDVVRSKPHPVGKHKELALCMLFLQKTSFTGAGMPLASSTEIDQAKGVTVGGFGLTEITQGSSPGTRGTAPFTVTSPACNGTGPGGNPDESEFDCRTGFEVVAKAAVVKGGTCSGDSGGPLLLKRSDGKLAVAALTRRAIAGTAKCGRESIFVRIDDADSRTWINTTTAP